MNIVLIFGTEIDWILRIILFSIMGWSDDCLFSQKFTYPYNWLWVDQTFLQLLIASVSWMVEWKFCQHNDFCRKLPWMGFLTVEYRLDDNWFVSANLLMILPPWQNQVLLESMTLELVQLQVWLFLPEYSMLLVLHELIDGHRLVWQRRLFDLQ